MMHTCSGRCLRAASGQELRFSPKRKSQSMLPGFRHPSMDAEQQQTILPPLLNWEAEPAHRVSAAVFPWLGFGPCTGLDLWQRVYRSLPSTLLRHFRAPPQASEVPCVDSTKIRLQRFPTVALESALFPAKGLCATQAFAAGETIATFAKNDCRLRLLLMQHRKLPFPTATTCLVPFVCHCGSTHLRLKAADDLPVDTILLLGEPHNWQGCLLQFDGSAHKHTQTGGAGVSLLHNTQTTTNLVQWLSIALLSCTDNVIAEAHACRAAIELAFNYCVSCLSKDITIDGVVIQKDILPIINYLQHRGRVKKPEVVAILDHCQRLLARAPCQFTCHRSATNLQTILPPVTLQCPCTKLFRPISFLNFLAFLLNTKKARTPQPLSSRSASRLLHRSLVPSFALNLTISLSRWITLRLPLPRIAQTRRTMVPPQEAIEYLEKQPL